MRKLLLLVVVHFVFGFDFLNAGEMIEYNATGTPTVIPLTELNVAYKQTFMKNNENGLAAGQGIGFDVIPPGWALSEEGISTYGAINGKYRAAHGEALARDTYSFGELWESEDRAFGAITGTELPNVKIGAFFVNRTGSIITELLISYAGEQWRQGGSGIAGKLEFAYSTTAEDLTWGACSNDVWIKVPQLDFTSPQTETEPTGLNGNLPANRKVITYKITGLSILKDAKFWIRWENANASGGNTDDGLAIDDVFVTPGVLAHAQPAEPVAITLNASNEVYEQNFNTLEIQGNDKTLLPPGWAFLETGGNHADGKYWARAGVQRNDTYSMGNGNSSIDRALGSVVGPNMQNSKIGAKFINNTGETITELLINYVGEQWRRGNTGVAESLKFSYSKDATHLGTGTWIEVSALDFTAIHSSTSAATFIGDDEANRKAIKSKITGLEIEANATFWIRWENNGLSNAFPATGDGNADALAIDDFSIIPNPQTTPVSLSSFTHKKVGNTVQFKWETVSERGNDYFELLRSADVINFNSITRISGRGNTDGKSTYSYTDFNPLRGVNYYRLKQVDYNGKSEIYPVVSVNFDEKELDFNIYISEGDDININISIYSSEHKQSALKVIDTNGRELLKKEIALSKGISDVKFNIPVAGVYVVVLTSGSSVIKKKFLIK